MCAFSRYDLANVRAEAYDVTVNRGKAAAYRAPGSPIAAFAVESVLDALAKKISVDPLEFRLKNAARNGSTTVFGQTFHSIGYAETISVIIPRNFCDKVDQMVFVSEKLISSDC